MKTVMISLPILLVAVIACTQVAGDERGKEQRITSLYRKGKTSEHPKLLLTQTENTEGKILQDTVTDVSIKKIVKREAQLKESNSHEAGKNLFLARNETKSKQNVESTNHQKATPNTNVQPSKPAPKITQNSKIDLKQTPKPVLTNTDKHEENLEHKKTNIEKELSTASPAHNKHGDSVTTTTEDDRIGGTVLTSLGGAPGK